MLFKVASRFGFVPLELQFGHGAASVLLQPATPGHFWVGLTLSSAARPNAKPGLVRRNSSLDGSHFETPIGSSIPWAVMTRVATGPVRKLIKALAAPGCFELALTPASNAIYD